MGTQFPSPYIEKVAESQELLSLLIKTSLKVEIFIKIICWIEICSNQIAMSNDDPSKAITNYVQLNSVCLKEKIH